MINEQKKNIKFTILFQKKNDNLNEYAEGDNCAARIRWWSYELRTSQAGHFTGIVKRQSLNTKHLTMSAKRLTLNA